MDQILPNEENATPAKKQRSALTLMLSLGLIAIALVAGSIIWSGWYTLKIANKAPMPPSTPIDKTPPIVGLAVENNFAAYQETPSQTGGHVPSYTVKPDLTNITNLADVKTVFDPVNEPNDKPLLVKNGFVVKPRFYREFYELYEGNRYEFIPSFITTDSVLHNYHIYFDHLLKTLEETKLTQELKALNSGMIDTTQSQATAVRGTVWANAAKRNLGFFSVGSKLLDPSFTIPNDIEGLASHELSLIDAHSGIAISPVMNIGAPVSELENLKEDYSQYVPRGHYNKSDALKAYFKNMMWYGRLTFRFKNPDEVRSAILITLALEDRANRMHWDNIYAPTNFFVGQSDDVTYTQMKTVLDEVYGKNATLANIIGDDAKFTEFMQRLATLNPPQINSVPIFNSTIQPDRNTEIKGFRFMGQRFTLDAAIFQRLIDRDVPGRMLPKGLDIPASMGSTEATKILFEMGENKYGTYPENLQKLQTYTANVSTSVWTQNLYWGWLYTLLPLTERVPQSYPSFMQNDAWTRKSLATYLASWTELKHDTILYAKQVYAEMGGGGEGPKKKDDRGYVEPNPLLYARLAALLQMTQAGLEQRKLLNPADKEALERFHTLVMKLKTISEKELNNQTLSDDEYEFIRGYGGDLEHFWLDVNKADYEASNMDISDFLNQNSAAIVADVATDPNGTVLEEATGYINEIFAVVPIDGALHLVRGAVYTYYEFPWPIADRLTDERWRDEILPDPAKRPTTPSWMTSFISGQ